MAYQPGDVLVLDSDFFNDPYLIYAELRASGRAHRVVLPGGQQVWAVTGYEDARAVLVDPRLSKKLSAAAKLLERPVIEHMLNSDPPEHDRLRRLIGKAFTARRMRALKLPVEKITEELLDSMLGRRQAVDLVKDFAFPLATRVLSELLGVSDDDGETFGRWAETVVDGGAVGQSRTDQRAMAGYLARLVAHRRTNPGDDALSALVHATDGADRLTDVELVMAAFLLLVAGHDTVVGMVGNGLFALLCHPDQRAALLAEPSLVPGAVEELLRFTSPANFTTLRCTTAPVDVGDVTIPAGEFVVVALGSANHDPRRFSAPERLDVRRPAGGHLAFGHGIHYCLGASLARLVGEVAIPRLLHTFPEMRLATEMSGVTWLSSTLLRGLESLPVMVGRME